jgi:hypothetical protein
MSLVKFGAGIVQMSGSIAGVVHARNRFGNYIRPRTKPVNPGSSGQVTIREALAMLAQRWHDTLSAAQRTAWATYAAAVAMKNRLGESVYLTGFNMYLRTNIVRIQMENSKCDDAPTILNLPEQDPTFAIAAYASTQNINITWDNLLPWTGVPASILCLWQGVPQGATRNFFNGPWRKLGSIPGNQAPPKDKTATFTLVTGQRIWVYSRISTGPTDSRLSEPMVASCTVQAAPP